MIERIRHFLSDVFSGESEPKEKQPWSASYYLDYVDRLYPVSKRKDPKEWAESYWGQQYRSEYEIGKWKTMQEYMDEKCGKKK